jgi:hypothetical protein
MFPLSLSATVGSGLVNDEDDVKAMAVNLSWLGYPEAEPAADTGQWDDGVEDGLREYQRERGLTVDGWAGPDGETERALNGDAPRPTGERDPSPAAGIGMFERILDRLSPAGIGRAQPGSSLLDGETRPRANPFAAARAHFARTSVLDHDAGAPPFGRNTITGEPLRLKPLAPAAEGNTPATRMLEETERRLTNLGYRYRPDPMGRLGEGDWLDANGNALDPKRKYTILAEAPTRPEPLDFIEFSRQVLGLPTRDTTLSALDSDNLEDRIDAVQDDGGGRSWRGLFRSGRGIVIGGAQGIPPELSARLAHIKDAKVRASVDRLLRGSAAEPGTGKHPDAAYNLYKPGNTSTGLREFHQTVRAMGGDNDAVRQIGPGQWLYRAGDGTRLVFSRRFEAKKRQPTTELHIERDIGEKTAKVKIRYND